MIILVGIAGSGKGTQAELLAKKLNCPIVSTGDLLRNNQDKSEVKAALDSGVLVGDEILLPLLEAEFSKIGANKKEFMLDGTPRNVKQAKWLMGKIKKGELKFTAIIHFLLNEQTALERLKTRARHDDSDEAIHGRFKFYRQSVLPAVDYFRDQGLKVHDVDASKTPEVVAADVEATLKE